MYTQISRKDSGESNPQITYLARAKIHTIPSSLVEALQEANVLLSGLVAVHSDSPQTQQDQ
jgi:hypothetical protein